MDEDSPREQIAPPPDKRSARVPIMLAVSGVVLATALGTVATLSAAPKTTSGQSPNQRVQVNPYTGQTVGTSATPTTDTNAPVGSPTPVTSTTTAAPTTTRRMIVTTTSGPHGITTVTIPDPTQPSSPSKSSDSNPPTDNPPTDSGTPPPSSNPSSSPISPPPSSGGNPPGPGGQ